MISCVVFFRICWLREVSAKGTATHWYFGATPSMTTIHRSIYPYTRNISCVLAKHFNCKCWWLILGRFHPLWHYASLWHGTIFHPCAHTNFKDARCFPFAWEWWSECLLACLLGGIYGAVPHQQWHLLPCLPISPWGQIFHSEFEWWSVYFMVIAFEVPPDDQADDDHSLSWWSSSRYLLWFKVMLLFKDHSHASPHWCYHVTDSSLV